MNHIKTNRIVLSGMLAAVGVLLPFITAHAFGVPGTILLPMHIPVFLIGLLCGPLYGAIGGIMIPVMSSLLTGMPTAFPMLPIMAGELFTYGVISGILYRRFKFSIYPSLLLAMLGGRVVYGLIFAAMFFVNSDKLKALSVPGALLQGLPGIIVQLVLIPIIVTTVNKYFTSVDKAEHQTDDDILNEAKQMIKNEKASCVIIKNHTIIHSAKGPGVAPLIALYENNPDILKDAIVVDKVIGKAAAMIAECGGVKKVYGIVMSTAARSYLFEHNIQAGYDTCVNIISNRSGDGLCPLEKAVMHVGNAQEAYIILKDTIKKLHKAV